MLILASETGLRNGRVLWKMSSEGKTQGDPWAAVLFCVGIHPLVRELCRVARKAGGTRVFGMADG